MKITDQLLSEGLKSLGNNKESIKDNAKASFQQYLKDLETSRGSKDLRSYQPELIEETEGSFLLEQISLYDGNAFLTEEDKKAIETGESLIKSLEGLREDLCKSQCSDESLARLKSFMGTYYKKNIDPELQQSLKEIEMRAAIEIAKFE